MEALKRTKAEQAKSGEAYLRSILEGVVEDEVQRNAAREQVAALWTCLHEEWFPLSDSQSSLRQFTLDKLDQVWKMLGGEDES